LKPDTSPWPASRRNFFGNSKGRAIYDQEKNIRKIRNMLKRATEEWDWHEGFAIQQGGLKERAFSSKPMKL